MDDRYKKRHAAARRAKVAKWKAAGLCAGCGLALDTDRTRCSDCLAKAKAYQAMLREINRENGLTSRGTPID